MEIRGKSSYLEGDQAEISLFSQEHVKIVGSQQEYEDLSLLNCGGERAKTEIAS